MQRITLSLVLLLSTLFSPLSYAELSQAELQEILAPRIEGLKFLTKNGMLLESIRAQNRKGMTLDEIKKIDEEWKAGTSPLIQELQENKAGNFLKNILFSNLACTAKCFLLMPRVPT